MISFRKIKGTDEVSSFIAKLIKFHLGRGSVFWLTTGGSMIDLEVDVAQQLQSSGLSDLTVSLTDERFGPPGHGDSNWQQLEQAGFSMPGSERRPVLLGQDLKSSTKNYDGVLKDGLKSKYKIAAIGVGPDNHIAGLKPLSPALASKSLATSYDWDDFQRLSVTFETIKQLDCAVVHMSGEAKRLALENLQKDLPLDKYPSQILKQVKRAIIFTDMVGETN